MIQRVAYLCMQATQEGQASYAHVNEIINGLRRRGVAVDLFEPRQRPGRPRPGLLGRAWGFLAVQIRLLFQLHTYDALYIRGHFATVLGSVAAFVFRVPQVYEVNGPPEDMYVMYPWTRPIGAFFMSLVWIQHRLGDAIVANTPQMAAYYAARGNYNIHVIPNGANVEVFHPGARSPEAPEGPYAIFFGAFSPWQGIRVLLDAVALPEWPAGTRLVVIGDGTERARVEAAAAAGDRVLYLGVKTYRDLPGFVAPAAVGICAKDDFGHSVSGLSPLKLYEMMAAGLPVVVSDLPGQVEVVQASEGGLIIKPGDPVALAKAVAWLIEHPEEARAMGARGHDLVVREHSWDKRSQDTLDVLQGIARGVAAP